MFFQKKKKRIKGKKKDELLSGEPQAAPVPLAVEDQFKMNFVKFLQAFEISFSVT